MVLQSPRLWLLPLSREMLAARVQLEDFGLECATPEGKRWVHFGPQWPGDGIALFPKFLESLGEKESVDGTYTIVDRASVEAIGLVGTKGVAQRGCPVEIGYGVNEDFRARGVASEAVGALTAQLLEVAQCSCVTAETAVSNMTSGRVLEKNGFQRVGASRSEEDGDLICWSRVEGVRPPRASTRALHP